MNYELVKQLEDSGFPKTPRTGGWANPESTWPIAVPNLSELIAACGKNIVIWYADAQWNAAKYEDDDYHYVHSDCIDDSFDSKRGTTPEEAVVRLWLALNPKA